MNSEFEKSFELTKSFTSRPTNDELLLLYALYKQATEGDNVDDRPGGFDFKAIAKHDAWVQQKGKTNEQAQQEYITLVGKLKQDYS